MNKINAFNYKYLLLFYCIDARRFYMYNYICYWQWWGCNWVLMSWDDWVVVLTPIQQRSHHDTQYGYMCDYNVQWSILVLTKISLMVCTCGSFRRSCIRLSNNCTLGMVKWLVWTSAEKVTRPAGSWTIDVISRQLVVGVTVNAWTTNWRSSNRTAAKTDKNF